jgi:hypothetical protein
MNSEFLEPIQFPMLAQTDLTTPAGDPGAAYSEDAAAAFGGFLNDSDSGAASPPFTASGR